MKQKKTNSPFLFIAYIIILILSISFVQTAASQQVARSNAEPYLFLQSWGKEIGDLGSVQDVAVYMNRIYVADGYGEIQVFDLSGTPLFSFGIDRSGQGQFSPPRGITVDSQGNVFVADSDNHRIQKFSNDGTFLTAWGISGSTQGQFYYPDGITVDSQGNVFVADSGNDRIQKFALKYPDPDPEYGLALNGSFEASPPFTHWHHGGDLDRSLSSDTPYGNQAVRLGKPVAQVKQPAGSAWLHQTIYVRPEWERPILSFNYRMFVNDTIDYSDFRVWVTMSNGGVVAELLRDGYRSCNNTAPPPGTDLGWRAASYDLSEFKGQTVRIRFENRNIHHNKSWGIWTYVDNVSVLDAGALPPLGSERFYLPLVRKRCDG